MDDYLFGLVEVFGYGLWTTIQPCPLASNVAALGFLGGQAGHWRRLLLSGLLLVTGQVSAYVGLAVLLSLVARETLAYVLEDITSLLLGPALILAGMLILGLLPKPWRGSSPRVGGWLERYGASVVGAYLIGVLIAITFCPATAAAFFGLMLPAALRHGSWLAYPAVYGLGTGLPILTCALLAVAGVNLAHLVRRRDGGRPLLVSVSGWLLIALGIGLSVVHLIV